MKSDFFKLPEAEVLRALKGASRVHSRMVLGFYVTERAFDAVPTGEDSIYTTMCRDYLRVVLLSHPGALQAIELITQGPGRTAPAGYWSRSAYADEALRNLVRCYEWMYPDAHQERIFDVAWEALRKIDSDFKPVAGVPFENLAWAAMLQALHDDFTQPRPPERAEGEGWRLVRDMQVETIHHALLFKCDLDSPEPLTRLMEAARALAVDLWFALEMLRGRKPKN